MLIDITTLKCNHPDFEDWKNRVLSSYMKKNNPLDLSERDIHHIIDYLESSYAPKRIKKMSVEQAHRKAGDWTKALAKKGRDYDEELGEDIEEVLECVEFMWVKLLSERAYQREGKLMSHCFQGDTEVITSKGVKKIRDLVDSSPELLTKKEVGPGYFTQAPIKSYGTRALHKLTLKSGKETKEILTTDMHRWFAYDKGNNKATNRLREHVTTSLEPGMKIPKVFPKRLKTSNTLVSNFGVAHGVTYGDGSINSGNRARVSLYGEKGALERYFNQMPSKETSRSIGGVTVNNLPSYFKRLPSLKENTSTLLGFFCGWFAADGMMDKNGCGSISTSKKEDVQWLKTFCITRGIEISRIIEDTRPTNYAENRVLYKVFFKKGEIPKDWLLNPKHADMYQDRQTESRFWEVVSVEDTCTLEEVFCAEVPETGNFVLEGNILTGNCVGSYHGRDCEILSLRTNKNEPKVTIEVRNTECVQIQGKGNSNVTAKYHKEIMELFNHKGIELSENFLLEMGLVECDDEVWAVLEEYEGWEETNIAGKRLLKLATTLNAKEKKKAC